MSLPTYPVAGVPVGVVGYGQLRPSLTLPLTFPLGPSRDRDHDADDGVLRAAGLMNFTWKPQHTPDEQAFAAINAAVDAGATFLNTAEFCQFPIGRLLALSPPLG